MGEIDAAGDIVTGALLGRAMEPHAGEGAEGGHGGTCLNCGTALIGPHCHQCGQTAHIHRSLGAIGHDILHGVVHFEGKLWHTLPLLAFRPGKLTRRYIEGERARFVSPIALFLFSIFTLFAVFSLLGVAPQSFKTTPMTPEKAAETRAKLVESRQKAVAERARVTPGSGPAKALDGTIAGLDDAIARADAGKPVMGPVATDLDIETGWERLDHGIKKAIENPSLASYKLQSNSYKLSWALIPLSLPFLWLAFAWRREFGLYDHAIFVTYSIAFMSLLFIAVTLLSAAGLPGGPLNAAVAVAVPLHIYSQLRDAYRLSRLGAVLRTIYLLASGVIVLIVFLAGVLALGLLG
ncbi:DUF3667 domain-containing protein [Sphingomonas canadensis]|uniref:DUF3667 domain-containing protein n=1 Tax=Sphingomonas canadensis TaxID=1219257 RepID=A0ABW3H253_9SPHN|nr:DUF3667 domain-containing protein [Sphingomonas canadensis]MCW3834647.1 DUF3667 domain-containing protein [Sphingomonas canadensis]